MDTFSRQEIDDMMTTGPGTNVVCNILKENEKH